jgi:hypothetical protein
MYAAVEDVEARIKRILSDKEEEICKSYLEDAAIVIDAYNKTASEEAKKIVSCNIVIRILGTASDDVPIGATQGSLSALGYSQSWTVGSGAVGEIYLTRMDKKLLGAGSRIGFSNPYTEET